MRSLKIYDLRAAIRFCQSSKNCQPVNRISQILNLMSPDVCPNCGAEVPRNAKACPECGSDEQTGWSETAYASHLGLPDENFDHDEFVKREFGPEPVKPRGIGWFWWVVALLVVAGMLFFWLR